MARKSSWPEVHAAIKPTDVFRVNSTKVWVDIRPSRTPYLQVLIKFSTRHSRGHNHSVYIFLSYAHVHARELCQIKFGTSFRLNVNVRTCANFREIRKSGKVIRQSRSLLCRAYFLQNYRSQRQTCNNNAYIMKLQKLRKSY